MVVTPPTLGNGGPSRALVLKQWYKVSFQVIGAVAVVIGTSKDEAGRIVNGVTADGIQLTSGNTSGTQPPYQTWWKGELWVLGEDVGAQVIIMVPGLAPSVFEKGGGECAAPDQTEAFDSD